MKTACVLVVVLLSASRALGQSPAEVPAESSSASPFEIKDNSLLVEEAFNQDAGVVQTFGSLQVDEGGTWTSTLTQEWPLFSHTHQISYTLAFADAGAGGGIADTMVHYRLQVMEERRGRPAFAPRISLIAPTGDADAGRGLGHAGWQMNLPFSKQVHDTYFHWNAGVTRQSGQTTPNLGGSAVYRARPMFNLMLETVVEFAEDGDAGSKRHAVETVSPGFRTGWNRGEKQTVLAVEAPVEISSGGASIAVIGYLSYEAPFSRR